MLAIQITKLLPSVLSLNKFKILFSSFIQFRFIQFLCSSVNWFIIETLCAVWYHLYNLKNVRKHGGVLLSLKLQASSCNFTNINIPPSFFTFFKLYKWHQITQMIIYDVRILTLNGLVSLSKFFTQVLKCSIFCYCYVLYCLIYSGIPTNT